MSFAATLNPQWVTAGPWRQFGNWYLPSQSFDLSMLRPYAVYDANVGGSAAGITDSSGNGRAAMTVGGGSNSPLWLPYTEPALTVPRTTDYVSTSVNVTLATGQTMEFVHRYSGLVVDATFQTIGSFKALSGSSNSAGISVYANATGVRGFGGDGASPAIDRITAAGGALPSSGWLRVRFTPSAASTITVETAPDAATEPSSWTLFDSYTGGNCNGFTGVAVAVRPSISQGTTFPAGVVTKRFIGRVNGVAVADFDPALCGQTGYTGPLGNVWTITRSTSGRKAVIQSPAADSAESFFLLGTDDWLNGPAAAQPPLGVSDAATFVWVMRAWPTPVNVGRIYSSEASATDGVLNWLLTAGTFTGRMADGTNFSDAGPTAVATSTRAVIAQRIDGRSATGHAVSLNGGAFIAASNASVGAITNRAWRIGASANSGTSVQDLQFRAVVMFDRALSQSEVAQTSALFRGGL